MPLPGPVGQSDSGISALKANADHSHSFLVGAETTTWFNLPLGPFVSNYGGGYRTAQYTVLGNLGFIRGLVAVSGAPGFPIVLGNIPVDIAPSAREMGVGMGFGGIFRIDLAIDGTLSNMGGITGSPTNPSYLSFGSPYFIYCTD